MDSYLTECVGDLVAALDDYIAVGGVGRPDRLLQLAVRLKAAYQTLRRPTPPPRSVALEALGPRAWQAVATHGPGGGILVRLRDYSDSTNWAEVLLPPCWPPPDAGRAEWLDRPDDPVAF